MPTQDTIAEIQTEISKLIVRVRLNTDAIGGVRHLLEHYRGMVQKYVARAVAAANPNNPNPEALQGALDNLNTLNAEIDAQAAAEAAILNTNAEDASTTDPTLTNGIVAPVEKPADVNAPSLPETPSAPAETPPAPAELTSPVPETVPETPLVSEAVQAEMQAGADALNSQPVPEAPAETPVEEATAAESTSTPANPAPSEGVPGDGSTTPPASSEAPVPDGSSPDTTSSAPAETSST